MVGKGKALQYPAKGTDTLTHTHTDKVPAVNCAHNFTCTSDAVPNYGTITD